MDADNITRLSMKEIFADQHFNCRGHIAPIDVVELSKDIDKHGLQQPIVVKPITNGESRNPDHKWKIISGHRRHMAFKVLKRDSIPCIVNDAISDKDALILNLTENLHRKNLNIMQEARAIERLKMAGCTALDVAEQLGKSNTWVIVRYQLLELPDVIKEAAAAGFVTQAQIKELHKLGDYKKQVEMAKKIKEAKARGDKVPTITRPKRDMFKRKPRDVADIEYMQDHIREHIGNNFGTRCLAWAAGHISDLELYRDIEEVAIKAGIEYKVPYKEGQ